MLSSTQLGCSQTSTSFSDIIINQCNAIADGLISGFGQFAHDPKYLNQTVQMFNQQKIPSRFADAVVLRRIETQKLDDIWDFPLNMTCETTVPLPWTICEATRRGNGNGTHSYEYNIMRIIDFIGKNYVRLVLPEVSTSEIRDSAVVSDPELYLQDKRHIYLGAWHRDLIPRIIQKVSFYPRQNAHKLFDYTGYDIFVYNILFGNAAKRMNDLMAGEDQFELCYDPYRTHGSALGHATYKGIDNQEDWSSTTSDVFTTITESVSATIGTDSFTDAFFHDTYMSGAQFKDIYRKNVWYEAPVAKNYHVRHSIHSRRFIHSAKIIVFPLDILPFGYSIASSFPTAALAGDCGYISIDIFPNWFDRAFYLTKLSDIPVLFPVVNHQHFVPGDVCYTVPRRSVATAFDTSKTATDQFIKPLRITAGFDVEGLQDDTTKFLKVPTQDSSEQNMKIDGAILRTTDDQTDVTRLFLGWVNPNSIGKFGRADFWEHLSGLNPDRWEVIKGQNQESQEEVNDVEEQQKAILEALSNSHMVTPESVVGGANPSLLEGIIPMAMKAEAAGTYDHSKLTFRDEKGKVGPHATFSTMGSATTKGGITFKQAPISSGNTSSTFMAFSRGNLEDIMDANLSMIYKPSSISEVFYRTYVDSLQVKLFQVGYQSMPSIRQFLSKLPNIYVTTEWNNDTVIPMTQSQSTTFNINNDLYIQAIMFWFIPVDNDKDMEQYRLYPHHLVNHEMPVIPGIRITNEQSQGTTVYDWQMMNEITPHLLGLYNPLLENMGLVSFTPRLSANQLPLAYYDTNISGYITVNVLSDDSQVTQTTSAYNLRSGYLKVISIGTNGVASVNLNLYRLIF